MLIRYRLLAQQMLRMTLCVYFTLNVFHPQSSQSTLHIMYTLHGTMQPSLGWKAVASLYTAGCPTMEGGEVLAKDHRANSCSYKERSF